MKNVNQLEKQRKEVLSNMKEEEINKIYENLSNEYVSYLWNFKNNFKDNEEGIHDITKKFMDLEIDLKDKYRTDLLVSNSMMFSLLEDHDENTIEIMNLRNRIVYLKLNTLYSLLESDLSFLKICLYELFVSWEFRYRLSSFYKIEEYIKNKFNLDIGKEEDLNLIMEIEEDVHELSIEFYNERFDRTEKKLNFIIERLVNRIDKFIEHINPYFEDVPKVSEDTIKELVPMLRDYENLQEEIKETIREYEKLKVNPFEEIIESTNELNIPIETVPEYDFEEFELKVPDEEGVIE